MKISIAVKRQPVLDANTKLLLHFDEDPFTDSSLSEHTISNVGVTRSTTQSQFGGYSGYFHGDYLSIPNNSDWDFGSDNFTIDFWLYTTALPVSGWYSMLVYHASDTVYDKGFWIFLNGSGSGNIWFSYSTNGAGTGRKDVNFGVAPPLNAWTHVAIVRNSTSLTLYFNGVGQTTVGNMATDSIYASTQPLTVGTIHPNTAIYLLYNSYIDELRISKGVARWTADFTPPTIAY